MALTSQMREAPRRSGGSDRESLACFERRQKRGPTDGQIKRNRNLNKIRNTKK